MIKAVLLFAASASASAAMLGPDQAQAVKQVVNVSWWPYSNLKFEEAVSDLRLQKQLQSAISMDSISSLHGLGYKRSGLATWAAASPVYNLFPPFFTSFSFLRHLFLLRWASCPAAC